MKTSYRKKLIEVALPLEAINAASVRENFIYRGNPSALHKWWAQRPLAAARAILFAQLVDDPSANPDLFPTEKAQQKERQRLFKLIEQLVTWENTTNSEVLDKARTEIWQSWRRACAENVDHPRAHELFDRHRLPKFCDPFAGGATLPLEAQRLGLEAHASDLNPVAVLINKALVEIPPAFANRIPVNPDSRIGGDLIARDWRGTEGLAEDVRYYGRWIRDEAAKRLESLYPASEITRELAVDRSDLKPFIGRRLPVIAWLWARTVRSPNPAFAKIEIPIAATFLLSTKAGRVVSTEPVIGLEGYHFVVRIGDQVNETGSKNGTKLARGASFRCVMSSEPIPPEYIYSEAKAGRMGSRLMAVVVESEHGRMYLSPTPYDEMIAKKAQPKFTPDLLMADNPRSFSPPLYGLTTFGDIFSPRQLDALSTLSELVREAQELIRVDCAGLFPDKDDRGIAVGGRGAVAYSESVATMLAFAVDKTVEYGSTLVPWYAKEDRPKGVFSRQAIPMVWDYAEVNPLSDIGGSFLASVKIVAGALTGCCPEGQIPVVSQRDAMSSTEDGAAIISTDPPYYDNIPYADLSDFFYVWLRHSLKPIWPDLFATLSVPKTDELVAIPYRHGGKQKAETFFLEGMTTVMTRLAEKSYPGFPVSIYYAFKQSETSATSGTSSTGWETFLDAVIRAGFGIYGTWPIRTERGARSVSRNSNALASSIILVCRPRPHDAPAATLREFLTTLRAELPTALINLQRGNIAPVDLAQAAIGPGMAVYTRYSKVIDADGNALSVRQALASINEMLDEVLAQQEGDFDSDTRWALAWFEQFGFGEGDYGFAETLSKAKNTSVSGMVQAGILASKNGRVHLLPPDELTSDWDPLTDSRLTVWEMVHHLIRTMAQGESRAATLLAKLGTKAEIARELAYRLFALCERKKRANEALAYNALVLSWPEILRLARATPTAAQTGLFEEI